MNFGLIVAGSFIASIIIGWIVAISKGIVHFLVFARCIGKEKCKKDSCCLRGYCNRTAWSDKEKDVIRKKIESMDDGEGERK